MVKSQITKEEKILNELEGDILDPMKLVIALIHYFLCAAEVKDLSKCEIMVYNEDFEFMNKFSQSFVF